MKGHVYHIRDYYPMYTWQCATEDSAPQDTLQNLSDVPILVNDK